MMPDKNPESNEQIAMANTGKCSEAMDFHQLC